jgi:hypothetical protein
MFMTIKIHLKLKELLSFRGLHAIIRIVSIKVDLALFNTKG